MMKRMIQHQGKRTLALVVSFLLVMSCIVGIIPQAAAPAIWSDEQTDRPADSLVATYANHPTGTGDVNGTASSFTVKATVENHQVKLSVDATVALRGTTVYAAVMDYKSFADPNGPNGVVTNWDSARFSNPGGANVKNTSDYRYTTGSFAAPGTALELASWTIPSGSSQTLRPINIWNDDASTNGMRTDGDKNTEYYRSYFFIVMSGTIGNGAENFAYGTFIMDSQGNMLEGSYLVRYNKNATANYRTAAQAGVTGTIGNQQTPWAEPTTLRKDKYTRTGFDFKGWDTSAVFAHQWKANAATTADAAYVYKPWSEIEADGPQPAYQPEGTLVPTAVAGLDKYDSVSLFAAWYPRQVQYAPTGTKTNVTITDKSAAKADLGNNRNSTADVSTLNVTVPMITLPSPQVGVGYTQSVPLGGTSDKTTGKSYQIVYGVKFKAADDGPEITTDNTLSRFGVGYSSTPKDHAEVISVTGGPTNHSNGANVHMLLKVTDNANGTTDYLMIRFVEVKKGAQPAPTLDQNTGLQSRITEGTNPTNPEEKISDGQIFGFYSDGPMIQKSAGETSGDASGYFPTATNNTGTYGTGTMTSYYLNMGMVYEYRPQKITIDGAQVDLTAKWAAAANDADPEAKQAAIDELKAMGFYYELNQGYREVPFPETWYPNAAQKTALTASLALNAKTVTTSTKNGNNSNAVVAAVPAVPAGFAGDEGTGWHSGYGWITFDTEDAGTLHKARTSLPVIHGLTQDDVYQVRFRKNATREVSADREITIGGAAGGSSGPADPSSFAPVVLYDWDGTTVLGSLVVDKNNAEAAKQQIDEFTAALYPAGYDPQTGKDGVLYDASSPLTNKKGYSFGKWINLNATHEDGSEVFTIYGDAISITSSSAKETIEEPADMDMSELATNGLLLKAAFQSNAEMTQSTKALEREYVVSYNSFNRYADASAYTIKVRVQREYQGTGIQRCRTPALRVEMSDGKTTIFSLVNIKIADDQIAEIAAPPTVKTVKITVIDIGGVSNWVNGTTVRSRTYSADAVGKEPQSGYVFEGNLAYINDILDSGTGTLAATHYTVAELTVSKGNVHGTTQTGGAALRNQALANLREAYAAKNANGTHVGLTWPEMRDAIKDGAKPAAVAAGSTDGS